MRLGENNHKRPQGSHKIHYIKNFELNLNSFLDFCSDQNDRARHACSKKQAQLRLSVADSIPMSLSFPMFRHQKRKP